MDCFKVNGSFSKGCNQQLLPDVLAPHIRGIYDTHTRRRVLMSNNENTSSDLT